MTVVCERLPTASQEPADLRVHGFDHGVEVGAIRGSARGQGILRMQRVRRLVERMVRRIQGHPQEVRPILRLGTFDRGHRLIDGVRRGVCRRGTGHAVDRLRPGEVIRDRARAGRRAGVARPALSIGVTATAAEVPFAEVGQDIVRARTGLEGFGQRELGQRHWRQRAVPCSTHPGAESVAPGEDRRPSRRAHRVSPCTREQDALPRERVQVGRRGRRRCGGLSHRGRIEARHIDAEIVGDDQKYIARRVSWRHGRQCDEECQ